MNSEAAGSRRSQAQNMRTASSIGRVSEIAGEIGWSRLGFQLFAKSQEPEAHFPIYNIVSPLQKVVSSSEAAALVRAAQQANQTVVMCHGCFDIVHPGHVRHLQHAARLGDRLLVSVTGDSLVSKGAARPLIPQELRAENLAAFDCVTWVTINPHSTAAEILESVQPDVYVKGREYEHNRDPRFQREREIVERYGGRVVFSSGDVVFSSTALIDALEADASPVQSSLKQLMQQHDVSVARMDQLIASFQGKRVAVLGESIKDTYVMCERPAVAGESPIMTLRPLEQRSFDGGGAIIAQHLASMGARPTLITALPRSLEAEALRRRLLGAGVELLWVETDSPMIEKQRFLVGTHKVMKLDLGGPITLDASLQEELLQMACDAASSCEAAIIADFGQGLFTPAMLRQLCESLRPRVNILSGDVSGRRSSICAMRLMDLLTPSEAEIRDALHEYDEGLSSVAWRLLHTTKSKALIATLGEEGLIAFQRTPDADSNPGDWQTRLTAQPVPALARHAVDQLGCGDALLAAATLTLAASGSHSSALSWAAVLGSVAAAVQAQRLGNAVIGSAELRQGVRRLCDSHIAWQADAAASMSELLRTNSARARHDQLPVAHV